jgi:lipoate-protein ligase A
MKWLDAVYPSPAENLACDEALLDLCEEEGEEILRFWESRQHFVVLGYANKIGSEVNVEECRRRGVPVLRRCTGGGTVVQGPGCLNYNLTLRIPKNGLLTTVTGTNGYVMERNRAALEELLDMRVAVQGHTDLAFAEWIGRSVLTVPHARWFKFSGNFRRVATQTLEVQSRAAPGQKLGGIPAPVMQCRD